MKKNTRLLSLPIAVSAAAVLALSACGSEDSGDVAPADSAPADETQEAADTASGEAQTEEGSAPPDGEGSRGGTLEAATAAVSAAEAEADGTAYDIDFDTPDDDEDEDDDEEPGDGEAHWTVGVVSGDREQDVHISADGAAVLGTDDEDTVDEDDRREFDAASVTLVEALETAAGHTSGAIDDASLDDDDGGTLHWEVSIYPDGETRSTDVDVDASSGDVIER